MHPAASVIFFTVASGAGYGLLALTGTLFALGRLPASGWFGFWTLGLAAALITAGLLASTLHLGHPERAWRAVTQVRSSWLSREGVAALATYVPFAIFGVGWVFLGDRGELVRGAALAAAALAVVTVWCTAMIYRSLRPVHQWCNGHVVPVYLALALLTGALWLDALLRISGAPDGFVTLLAAVAAALGALLKLRYWRFIDTTRAAATAGTATGLGRFGEVRLLDPPHTGSNYLLDEMGFRLARKHALKLRRIALGAGFAAPLALTLAALALPAVPAALAALLAAASATAGALVERWLFFAEAKHTVTLYYGASAA